MIFPISINHELARHFGVAEFRPESTPGFAFFFCWGTSYMQRKLPSKQPKHIKALSSTQLRDTSDGRDNVILKKTMVWHGWQD